MRQPAAQHRPVEEIRVVIAFDHQVRAAVDDVQLQLEVGIRPRRANRGNGQVAELERRAELVDAEGDRDQWRATVVASDVQPTDEGAEGRARMLLGLGEVVAHRRQVLNERAPGLEPGSQRNGAHAVRDEARVVELRLRGEGDADDEVRLSGDAVGQHLERTEKHREECCPRRRRGALERRVQPFVDTHVLATGAVRLHRGPVDDREIQDRDPVNILCEPVVLVGRRPARTAGARLIRDVLTIGRDRVELRPDSDAIG